MSLLLQMLPGRPGFIQAPAQLKQITRTKVHENAAPARGTSLRHMTIQTFMVGATAGIKASRPNIGFKQPHVHASHLEEVLD